jgi:predicted neuraminidase
MIPPYRSNHASFLELISSNGILVMAWFSGSSEGADKCSIVGANLLPNSTQWSNATLISQKKGYSNQNPVLFFDETTGSFHLFHTQQKASDSSVHDFTAGVGSKEDTSHIWHWLSTDGKGEVWGGAAEVFSQDGSFDRNRILVSMDGYIYPIYYAGMLGV